MQLRPVGEILTNNFIIRVGGAVVWATGQAGVVSGRSPAPLAAVHADCAVVHALEAPGAGRRPRARAKSK